MTVRHQFVWNTASFSEAEDENALRLFEDALNGLIQFPEKDETAALYYDEATPLLQRPISKGLTVKAFIDHLAERGDHDLALVLTEIDDKTDAIYSLPEEQLNEIANSNYYFHSLGYTDRVYYLDLAAEIDGILFSAASADHWTSHEIEVGHVANLEKGGETGQIHSICNVATARLILALLHPKEETASLEKLTPECVIAAELYEWFNELEEENKRITRNKLTLARGRNFQGGEPLFKTLNNADGMREIRFKAFPGGAVRVLFGSLENGKTALLRGFIKKSDNEGYTENISAASKTWADLRAANKKEVASITA